MRGSPGGAAVAAGWRGGAAGEGRRGVDSSAGRRIMVGSTVAAATRFTGIFNRQAK